MTRDELRQRAVRLLARREHTRAELTRKLAPHGTEDDIKAVIEQLQAAKLQSDSRYAEAWLRSNATRLGAARLRQNLRQKGVPTEIADTALAEVDAAAGDELARARAIWARKFAEAPVDRQAWARQARFLQSRGFASEVIRRVVPAVSGVLPEDLHE